MKVSFELRTLRVPAAFHAAPSHKNPIKNSIFIGFSYETVHQWVRINCSNSSAFCTTATAPLSASSPGAA